VPDDALADLGALDVGAVANGRDLDAGHVLPLIVRHLVQERRQLVDGEARAAVELALASLLGRPVIAGEESQVIELVAAVLAVGGVAELEEVLRGLDDFLRVEVELLGERRLGFSSRLALRRPSVQDLIERAPWRRRASRA
jgi:hypothetical protein